MRCYLHALLWDLILNGQIGLQMVKADQEVLAGSWRNNAK